MMHKDPLNSQLLTFRRRSVSLAVGLLALVTVLLPGVLAAQDESAAPASIFGEVINVRVVNLEVVVTEKGERVTGLLPEDFLLTVDGHEIPVEYFTEVHGGTAVVRGDEAAAGTLPALAPGAVVSTSYLVFIDDFFMLAPRRNRVLRGLIEQLPQLNPEDRMAVVAFDGKKIKMLTSWNQSIPELTRVLEQALERPSLGLQRVAESRTYLATRGINTTQGSNLEIIDIGERLNRLDPEEEHEAERIADQVERAVLAATSALRSFANPPGRKVMLLLSGGWPYNPAQWVTGEFFRSSVQDVRGGDELYSPLIDTANRLSYTLYPIDVPHTQPSFSDASISTADASSSRFQLFQDRDQEQRTALSVIAADTGGKALLGGARNTAFGRVVADTRSYYWLGFTPTWQGDDSEHKVKLKTRHKGPKVRSRGSFSDLSRQTEVSMMVESALILGDSPSSSPLKVSIGESKRSGIGKLEVPLNIIIPVSELTFLPFEDQFVAETELRVAVQDESGNLSDMPVMPLAITLDAMPKPGELGRYDTRLKLRKRKHDMIISLYDNASGKIMTTKLTIDPRR